MNFQCHHNKSYLIFKLIRLDGDLALSFKSYNYLLVSLSSANIFTNIQNNEVEYYKINKVDFLIVKI